MIIDCRPKSPSRAEVIGKTLRPTPIFSPGVLIGNWVEDSAECPATGTYYIAPKDNLDLNKDKIKPEMRSLDFRQNKLSGLQGDVKVVWKHDSHDKEQGNYATTTDLVYNHLPQPLCGPPYRYYKRCKHTYYPQPDLMQCYGNITEWGLRKYWLREWKCNDVSDYSTSSYEDSFGPPLPHQYMPRGERKARNSSFTKSFRYKMTKS